MPIAFDADFHSQWVGKKVRTKHPIVIGDVLVPEGAIGTVSSGWDGIDVTFLYCGFRVVLREVSPMDIVEYEETINVEPIDFSDENEGGE